MHDVARTRLTRAWAEPALTEWDTVTKPTGLTGLRNQTRAHRPGAVPCLLRIMLAVQWSIRSFFVVNLHSHTTIASSRGMRDKNFP